MNSYTLRLYHGAPTLHLTWRSVFFVCANQPCFPASVCMFVSKDRSALCNRGSKLLPQICTESSVHPIVHKCHDDGTNSGNRRL